MHTSAWVLEVGRQYERAGLGCPLPAGKRPVVLVVDLIYGFTDPSFPAGSCLDDVVRSTRELVDAARAAAAPVIFTTLAFAKSRTGDNVWLKKMPAMHGLVEGSRWTAVDERLDLGERDPLIVKRAASAFTDTDLRAQLTVMQADSLVVCGATTSGCVRATVVDACMAGYPTFVPRECVGDRAAPPHEASLFDIQAKYGDVIDLERALQIVRASTWNEAK